MNSAVRIVTMGNVTCTTVFEAGQSWRKVYPSMTDAAVEAERLLLILPGMASALIASERQPHWSRGFEGTTEVVPENLIAHGFIEGQW